MNAAEIEEAISYLAGQPFDPIEFPYAFLEAFGNKMTTIQRLKSGSTNQSDIGGVLQRSNIHIKVCAPGEVAETLRALRESPKTASQKVKFILATDGIDFQAEALEGEGETLACNFPDVADHYGFFLSLAGYDAPRERADRWWKRCNFLLREGKAPRPSGILADGPGQLRPPRGCQPCSLCQSRFG